MNGVRWGDRLVDFRGSEVFCKQAMELCKGIRVSTTKTSYDYDGNSRDYDAVYDYGLAQFAERVAEDIVKMIEAHGVNPNLVAMIRAKYSPESVSDA